MLSTLNIIFYFSDFPTAFLWISRCHRYNRRLSYTM